MTRGIGRVWDSPTRGAGPAVTAPSPGLPRGGPRQGLDLAGRLAGSPRLCSGRGPSAAPPLGLSSLICDVRVTVPGNRDAAGSGGPSTQLPVGPAPLGKLLRPPGALPCLPTGHVNPPGSPSSAWRSAISTWGNQGSRCHRAGLPVGSARLLYAGRTPGPGLLAVGSAVGPARVSSLQDGSEPPWRVTARLVPGVLGPKLTNPASYAGSLCRRKMGQPRHPQAGLAGRPLGHPPLPTLPRLLGLLSQFFLEAQTSSQVPYSATVSGGQQSRPAWWSPLHTYDLTQRRATFRSAVTRLSDVGKRALRRPDSADGEGVVSRSSRTSGRAGRCLSKAPVSAARGRRPPPPPARLFRTSLGLVVWEGVGCLAMLVLTAILIPDSSRMKKVRLFGLPDTKAKAKAWNSRPGLSTRQHPELRRTLVRDPP